VKTQAYVPVECCACAGSASVLAGGVDKMPAWEPKPYNGLMLSANGIELYTAEDNTQYLLVGISLRKDCLYRINIATKEVILVTVSDAAYGGVWGNQMGIDGLRFLQDGSLSAVVYTNGGSSIEVLSLRSDNNWMDAELVAMDTKKPMMSKAALSQTTLSLKGDGMSTYVLATDWAGGGTVELRLVDFVKKTRMAIDVSGAPVPECATFDTDRKQWVGGLRVLYERGGVVVVYGLGCVYTHTGTG
jgi:hypothetical protein